MQFYFSPVEIFSLGKWAELNDYQDPQLQELARKLSNTLLHSRADSIAKKYLAAFKRWKVWALKYGMTVLPANDCQLALYIGDIEGSKASVEEAGNALAWVHKIPGLSSPLAFPIVKATLKV